MNQSLLYGLLLLILQYQDPLGHWRHFSHQDLPDSLTSTIQGEHLSPPMKYIEGYSDSELCIQESLVYSIGHYSSPYVKRREERRPWPPATWGDQQWLLLPPISYGPSHWRYWDPWAPSCQQHLMGEGGSSLCSEHRNFCSSLPSLPPPLEEQEVRADKEVKPHTNISLSSLDEAVMPPPPSMADDLRQFQELKKLIAYASYAFIRVQDSYHKLLDISVLVALPVFC